MIDFENLGDLWKRHSEGIENDAPYFMADSNDGRHTTFGADDVIEADRVALAELDRPRRSVKLSESSADANDELTIHGVPRIWPTLLIRPLKSERIVVVCGT